MAPLLLFLSILLRFAVTTVADSETSRSPATALFVLGDSTVSCAGSILPLNLTITSSLSGAGGPCFFFPSTRRLLPDLLAAKMGLPSPPLISTLNGTAAAAARGVNFGGPQYYHYGGDRGIFRMGAVGQQLRLAAETLHLLQLETGTAQDASSAAAEAAVFVLSFGTDAYARLLSRGGAEAADAAAPKHGRRGLGCLLADRIGGLGAVRGGGEEGGGDGGGAAGLRAARNVGGDWWRPWRLRGGGEQAHRGVQRQARGEAG
ncbi:hypothetical protein HU200_030698 [Digitaria exilis]|uniref:GDSL esterase/lipase n=1 Tax=Digitaria exilis TaxID=1010633 RepID=A0A835BS54_9POAL|nr:hypothetical protein HU200_030698 [Digitaria exilis]